MCCVLVLGWEDDGPLEEGQNVAWKTGVSSHMDWSDHGRVVAAAQL